MLATLFVALLLLAVAACGLRLLRSVLLLGWAMLALCVEAACGLLALLPRLIRAVSLVAVRMVEGAARWRRRRLARLG